MRNPILLAVGMAVATITSFANVAPAGANARSLCVPVRATGVGQGNADFTTTAVISVHGVRVGTTAAAFTPTSVTGSTLTFSGSVTFTDVAGLGTFLVGADGNLNTATGAFESTGPITHPTGIFRGVTGNLTFTGTEDLATGAFTEQVTGEICASNPLAVSMLG
jgi:hypothetical protein